MINKINYLRKLILLLIFQIKKKKIIIIYLFITLHYYDLQNVINNL